jgi:hypothetical protein
MPRERPTIDDTTAERTAPKMITITNKNATTTTLVVDGITRSIAGNGTITVGDDQLTRLLADNVGYLRFQPGGDLTHTSPAPSAGGSTSFAVTVDATALGTTNLVPAVPGYRWETRRTVFSVVASSGSPTAASVTIRSAGDIVQGVNADSTFAPLSNFAGSATATGNGLDVSVDAAATGGALSIQVVVEGKYSV